MRTERVFDPSLKIGAIKGKDYLDVKWRLLWFRQEHPKGAIVPELVSIEPVIVKATVLDGDGNVLGVAHAGAKSKGSETWAGREIEKAETAAIGRALHHAGYGTEEADWYGTAKITTPVAQTRANLNQGNNRRVGAQPAKVIDTPEPPEVTDAINAELANMGGVAKPVKPLMQHKPASTDGWRAVDRIQRIGGELDFSSYRLHCKDGTAAIIDTPTPLLNAGVNLEKYTVLNKLYDVGDGIQITVRQSDGNTFIDSVRLEKTG